MELPSGWGRGPPSRHKTKAAFRFKRRRPQFPARSRWKLRPHARGPRSSPAPGRPAPASHSPGPRGPPGQPERSSAAAAAEAPERRRRGRAAPASGSRRRRSGPRAPGHAAGQAPLPPARPTPCPPGPRPKIRDHTHHLAPRLRRAPRGPAGGGGGEVTR